MLRALINNDKNREVLSVECEKENNYDYYCPICGEKLIFKKGIKNIPHFSHRSDSNCPISKTNERLEHRLIKLEVNDLIKKYYDDIDIHIENRHDCGLISDIGGVYDGVEYAIEVHHKNINGLEFKHKLDTYKDNNIYSLHIFNKDNIKNPMIPNRVMQYLIDNNYPLYVYDLGISELMGLEFKYHDGYRKRRWNSLNAIRPYKLCINNNDKSLLFDKPIVKKVRFKGRKPNFECKLLYHFRKRRFNEGFYTNINATSYWYEDIYIYGTDKYIFKLDYDLGYKVGEIMGYKDIVKRDKKYKGKM